MAFHVDITEPAIIDSGEYFRFIRDVKKKPDAADRWYLGLVEATISLEELPERCPSIPEQDEFQFEIRQLIYFSHRIIFRVLHESNIVIVYRVYHGSRRSLAQGDLPYLHRLLSAFSQPSGTAPQPISLGF